MVILWYSFSQVDISCQPESASIQIHVNSHSRISTIRRQSNMPTIYCSRGDCRKPFDRLDKLDEHIRLHDNNLTNCPYCPWRGAQYYDFLIHMNHHFLIRPYKCSFCEISFYTGAIRNHHQKNLHDKIPDRYKCDQCPFVTHSYALCNQHKRIHR